MTNHTISLQERTEAALEKQIELLNKDGMLEGDVRQTLSTISVLTNLLSVIR